MRRTYKAGCLLVIVCFITFLLSACMGTPNRDDQRYEDEPIVWLYSHTAEGELPSLYRAAAGEPPLKIADRAVPGSHRVHGGNVLFLDDQGVLYYVQPEQEPHRLFEDVRPFGYDFLDSGLKVFAVTEDGELWLKTFGTDAQILAEDVEYVIRLPKHILAYGGGVVRSFNDYGEENVIVDKAEAMHISADMHYALISMDGKTVITDGSSLIQSIATPSDQLGFVQVSGDGSKLVFLDSYDAESGSGRLMVQELDMPAVNLANQVAAVAWDEERDQIWYTVAQELKLAKLESGEVRDISDQAVRFALSEADGSIAVALGDGTLLTIDAAGDSIRSRPAEGIRRLDHFGEGVMYATADGRLVIADAEDDIQLGRYDQWLHDERYIVYVEGDQVSATDSELSMRVLLDDRRAYRYVYYGERLLAETLLRVDDIVGVWHTADERTVEIQSSGRQKGTIKIGDTDTRPFYVTYAAYDHLQLMVIGELERSFYVKLRSDGSLELHDGKQVTEYVRNQ